MHLVEKAGLAKYKTALAGWKTDNSGDVNSLQVLANVTLDENFNAYYDAITKCKRRRNAWECRSEYVLCT